jgi:hypothetical protein
MAAGKTLSIVAGVVVAAALAGGGAYFVFDKTSGGPDASAVKIVELVNMPYSLAQPAEVVDRPMTDGKFLTHVRQGASVTVLGIVDGNAWLQIALPGNQIGYIPASAIPGVLSDETKAPAAPAQPAAPPVAAAPPAPAMPPADVASAQPPPPAAPVDGTEPPPPSDLVDFQSVDRQLNVVQATGLYLAPNEHAPQAYMVKVGTQVEVIAVSKDGKWGWVNVSDGTPAYLKLTDLSASDAPAAQ